MWLLVPLLVPAQPRRGRGLSGPRGPQGGRIASPHPAPFRSFFPPPPAGSCLASPCACHFDTGRGGYVPASPSPAGGGLVRASGACRGQPWAAEVRPPSVASRLRHGPAHSHIQGPTQLGHPGACLPEDLREGEPPSCRCTSRSCLRSRHEAGAQGLGSGDSMGRGGQSMQSGVLSGLPACWGARSWWPLGAVLQAAHRRLCPPPLPQAGRVARGGHCALGCYLLALRSADGLAAGPRDSLA